jgi:hypothetical protein
MPIEQVFRHVAGDRLLAAFQHAQIAVTHFRRHFEANVQQLADILVEQRIFSVVA